MSALLRTQVAVLARRAMLKTLRQPFQLFPIVFFPLILLSLSLSIFSFTRLARSSSQADGLAISLASS